MSTAQGRFVWYELMTGDMPAAVDFYKAVVGWTSQDESTDQQPYTLLVAGDAPVAGVLPTPEPLRAIGRKPSWSGYIAVDDVDAYAARVLQAGGKVHRPADDIPDVGRFAVVADPQGAGFVLFKPSREAPAALPAPGSAGTVGWHELHAMDGAAAFDFYADLFGWQRGDAIDMGPAGKYQLFTAPGGGDAIGGMMTKMAERPAPGWLYYVTVPAIDAAAAAAKAHGATITEEPMQVPGGAWIVGGLDPQGAEFKLTSMAR